MCLYQWRAHELSTASSVDTKPYAAIAGEKAVTEAMARRGRPCLVTYEPQTAHYRLKFELKEPKPLVSVIIPSKNSALYLRRCLESVFGKSTYPSFEVVISDNGSDEADCLELYKEYQAKYGERFCVDTKPAVFNFAEQINRGVARARGDYVLLLNNDTEVLTANWIEELLHLAQFPEVGAVGCKLLYPDGTIQHAGLMGAGRAVANHIALGLPGDSNIYFNTLNTIHEAQSVSGACLLVAKEKFLEAGGLDELYLPNGYGDVEFCLRLKDLGYTSLYTPYAKLVHFESKSRGKNIENFERHFMLRRRSFELLNDPNINLNFLHETTFQLDPHCNHLDLNNEEMSFFLQSPQKDWLTLAKAKANPN